MEPGTWTAEWVELYTLLFARSLSPMAQKIEKAIVVGASSGMGASVARELAAAGARVALIARRSEEPPLALLGCSAAFLADRNDLDALL